MLMHGGLSSSFIARAGGQQDTTSRDTEGVLQQQQWQGTAAEQEQQC